MTEKMPSSAKVGSRSMILRSRSYSSGDSPCSAICAELMLAFAKVTRAPPPARLGQDRNAVADAEDGHAGCRLALDFRHHRGMRRHGAGAQIVAIGEAAGQHDQVAPRQLAVAVPDQLGRPPGGLLERAGDV